MTKVNGPRYWGYRIDTSQIDFFTEELEHGRLRQGWGYNLGQDLRRLTMDEGASRNVRMFNEVKKGDILLVPRLPDWDKVSIVEATEDWNKGYEFDIPKKPKDYGHIFPAKCCGAFRRGNKHVSGNIRSTLKNPSRFWNIDHYSDDIEKICAADKEDLGHVIDDKDRLKNAIEYAFHQVFKREDFGEKVYEKLNAEFSNIQWENVLVEVLKSQYPHSHVERVGGPKEVKHGTDILIQVPGVGPEQHYAIAVQVKDHTGSVGAEVIDQIKKASHWNQPDQKLIEKVIIITRSRESENPHLVDEDVKFIFAEELKSMLTQYALSQMGLDIN